MSDASKPVEVTASIYNEIPPPPFEIPVCCYATGPKRLTDPASTPTGLRSSLKICSSS